MNKTLDGCFFFSAKDNNLSIDILRSWALKTDSGDRVKLTCMHYYVTAVGQSEQEYISTQENCSIIWKKKQLIGILHTNSKLILKLQWKAKNCYWDQSGTGNLTKFWYIRKWETALDAGKYSITSWLALSFGNIVWCQQTIFPPLGRGTEWSLLTDGVRTRQGKRVMNVAHHIIDDVI